MSIELPGWVVDAFNLVGLPWPGIDEDQLRAWAGGVRAYAAEITALSGSSRTAVAALAASNDSSFARTLAAQWEHHHTLISDLRDPMEVFAGALDVAADAVEAQKVVVIGAAVVLAGEVIATQGEALVTFGLAEAEVPAEVMIARLAVKAALQELEGQLLGMLINKAASEISAHVGGTVGKLIGGGGQVAAEAVTLTADYHAMQTLSGALSRHAGGVEQASSVSWRKAGSGTLEEGGPGGGWREVARAVEQAVLQVLKQLFVDLGRALWRIITDTIAFLKKAITALRHTDDALAADAKNASLDAEGSLLAASTRAGARGADSSAGAAVTDAEAQATEDAHLDGEGGATDDPVDVVTGEMYLAQQDLALPGVLPLVLNRRHGSSFRHGRLFGTTWASTLDQRIEIDDQEIRLLLEDGRILRYPRHDLGGGQVMPTRGPRWPLAWDSEDIVTVEQGDLGQTLHFLPGSPESGTMRPLAAITDRAGNRITFAYDGNGIPTDARHSGGYHVKIGTVSTPHGARVTSLALADPAGGPDIPVREFRYDSSGRLTGVVNGSGSPLLLEYDPAQRITQWTDRNGFSYRYFYRPDGRVERAEGDGGLLHVTLDYDLQARATTVTDALGNATVSYWNERMHAVRVVDPLGRETRTERDPYGQVLAVTDPLGRTTHVIRNEFGDATAYERPDGSTVTLTYAGDRSPLTVTGPDGGTWSYGYDDRGLAIAVTDPAGSVTRTTRGEHGEPTEIADPLGAVRQFGCNSAGLPVEFTDPSGAMWRLRRDAFGRVTEFTDPLGALTRQEWDPDGNLLARTHSDGARESWEYDAEGNLITYTSPTGARTVCEYGGFDIPVRTTGSDGSAYSFTYDAQLRLTGVTNPAGLTWRYEYDAAGQLVTETDFDGATVSYTHDEAAQLTARVNAAGQRIEYHRDLLGRVTRRRSGQDVHRYAYDAAGRLTSAVSPGAELAYTHDALGRVLTESVNGRTVSNTYDAAGNRTSRRTPAGVVSHWAHDAAGRPTALGGTSGQLSFSYDLAGRETARMLGPAASLTQEFDVLGRLTGQGIWAHDQNAVSGNAGSRPLQARTYAYRADGVPIAIDDALRGRREFTLDGAGRISAVTAATWTETYAYDAMGNLSQAAGGAADSDTDGDREIRGTRVLRAGRTTYTYDEAGRVVRQRRRTLSGQVREWTYSWDADDHLVRVTTPAGRSWRYAYDPLGRRISKEQEDPAGTVVTFAWDGPCLAEEERSSPAGNTALTWEYLPGTFIPAAQTRRSWAASAPQEEIDAEFHAIVTDLTGAPSELVAPDGTIAWHATRFTWGGLASQAPGETGCPLGFPGQYHDPETGLYYNLNRYYDPGMGAYLSSDPLGLAPAPNSHAYVPNPLLYCDPLGLQNCASEDPTWGGRVKFGELDDLGRPTGITATIERDMIGKGTAADDAIRPPGFTGGRPLGPDARGHLLGKQLGGSGDVRENLVTLYQNPVNTPTMSKFEAQVRKAVEGDPGNGIAGQVVQYKATPIYDGSQLRPQGVTLEAVGSGGFHLHVTIVNRKP